MKIRMLSLIFLGILNTFILKDVDGLMCYECNTLYDFDCLKLPDGKMGFNYRNCQPQKDNETVTEYRRPLCRKIRQKVKVRNNLLVIKRSCGWIRHKNIEDDVCYDTRNEDVDEVVCQCFTDGCNTSSINFINLYLMFSLCGLSFIIFYRR